MAAMDGSIKESAPNISRQTVDAMRPIQEEICVFSLSHCYKKMTTNMAVMTKLIPDVSNGSREPKRPPRVALAHQ